MDYFHYNPVKHEYVNKIKDWEYSSFHKFVKKGWYDLNWGTCEEINHIQDMDKE